MNWLRWLGFGWRWRLPDDWPVIIRPDDEPEDVIPENWDAVLLRMHNEYRADYGAPPLVLDARLDEAAEAHSQWMASTGRFQHASILFGGENIAWGYESPEAVFRGWENSPGHARNMRHADWTSVGFGFAQVPSGTYWTARFS